MASHRISSNHFRWKTTSHESIFTPSPPKSFAEEVANELCNRVRALGSSHPSVLIGKKKRLMDGLMNVAEAIRKDLPKTNKDSNISSPPKSRFLWSDADKEDETMEAGLPSTISGIVDDVEVKQNISELGSVEGGFLSDKNQDSKESDTYSQSGATVESLSSGEIPFEPNTMHLRREDSVETLSSGEVQIEPNTIHLRLTKDIKWFSIKDNENYSEYKGLSHVRGIMSPTGETRFLQKADKEWKPTKPKRLSKRKATVINFFQFRLRKKSRSEKKLKFRDRIVAFMNNDTIKNFRKGFRFIWSPRKTTEKTFAELKNKVLKLSKI